jgi:hypothetical protein
MSTGNLLRVEERMCLAVRQTGRQFGMDRTTLTTFSEEPTMPYLCLDPAKTYPPETKRELAERLYLNRRSDADSLRRGVRMSQQIADALDAFGGRTVVITGGGSGMGLSTARMVVNRAGRVILMGRSLGRLKAAEAELGPRPRLPSSMYNNRRGRCQEGVQRL